MSYPSRSPQKRQDKSSPPDVIAAAWRANAEAVADWIYRRLVTCHDAYGAYTDKLTQYTAHKPLTRDLLVSHARGETTIGFHLISVDNRCRGITLDIDAHDDKADPDRNLQAAFRSVELLSARGVNGHVFDSNGRGGYHVRALFAKTVAAPVAYWLVRSVTATLAAEGLGTHEGFPKQESVTLDTPYGNWVRAPGRHHKNPDHWSRVWSPRERCWLEGEAAIHLMIGIAGDPTTALLKAYRADLPPEPEAKPKGKGKAPKGEARRDEKNRPARRQDGEAKPDEAELRSALAALDAAKADDYGSWLGVGMALHDWDDEKGLVLWHEFSRRNKAKYSKEACDDKWTTFGSGGNPTTYRSIFKDAYANGWTEPGRNGKAEKVPNAAAAVGGRPSIEVTTERHEVTEQAIRALARDPTVFKRGEALVTVIEEERDEHSLTRKTTLRNTAGSPHIVELADATIGCLLTRNAHFFRWKTDEHGEFHAIPCHPPDWLVKAVAVNKAYPGIRPLVAVAECPFPRPDGSIVETPGYDPETRVLYRPRIAFPKVPARPTQANAKAAWKILQQPFKQFPFACDDDRIVVLAALLTAIARTAIDGAAPGFAVNGNRAGTGKGLLVDTIGILVLGRCVATSSYPADAVEADKVKLSLALSGRPIVHFDNIEEGTSYGGGAMDSAITSHTVGGRVLGASRDVDDVPLLATFLLSGNNISPRKDAYRRWLPINLITSLERPEERHDLEVRNLRGYLLEHRGELICAALTILRAHAIAGRPTDQWATLGSFEEWDPIVRGAVWFATGCDCCATRRKAADEAPERMAKLQLLKGWSELPGGDELGITTTNAVELVEANRTLYPTLREAFGNWARNGRPVTGSSLGYKLRGMKDTTIGGLRFVTCGEDHGSALWRVEQAAATRPGSPDCQDSGGDGGDRGDASNPPRANLETVSYINTYGGVCKSHGDWGESSPPSPPSPPTLDEAAADREEFIL